MGSGVSSQEVASVVDVPNSEKRKVESRFADTVQVNEDIPYIGYIVEMPKMERGEDCVIHGMRCRAANNEVEAAKWFQLASEQGNVEGNYLYGMCLLRGNGVSKDEVAAISYLRFALRYDHKGACNALGECHLTGIGVTQDAHYAFSLFSRASSDHHLSAAQYNIGCCYLNGTGVAKNFKLAIEHLHCGAAAHHSGAQNLLAQALRSNGITVMSACSESQKG